MALCGMRCEVLRRGLPAVGRDQGAFHVLLGASGTFKQEGCRRNSNVSRPCSQPMNAGDQRGRRNGDAAFQVLKSLRCLPFRALPC